jgi:hypothetical protein
VTSSGKRSVTTSGGASRAPPGREEKQREERQRERIPGPSEPGGLAAARSMLERAQPHVVAAYWREHYSELMRVDKVAPSPRPSNLLASSNILLSTWAYCSCRTRALVAEGLT